MTEIKKIKKIHVSDQVYEKMRDLIFTGYFSPRERILPERDLADEFGVSRTSIRTAIARLVEKGLLKKNQGRGTFIVSPDLQHSNLLATMISPEGVIIDDILEVRLCLEENAADFASKRASVKDIIALERSLDEIKSDLSLTGCISPISLIELHISIACASKNPVFINHVRHLYHLLFDPLAAGLKHICKKEGEGKKILKNCSMILLAIKNKNAKEARTHMSKHIKYLQDYLLTVRI